MNKFIKKYKSKWYIYVLIALIVFVLLGLNRKLKVVTYNIETEKITNKTKIAVITDLHSCKYGENQVDLINAIEKENPEVILLVGDIYDDVMPNENTSIFLEAMSKKYPMYYVTGNHEYWSDDINGILSLVQSFGITILEGTSDTININGEEINICGTTDPDVVGYTENGLNVRQQLDNLNAVSQNGNYTILLAHRPELIDTYRQYNFDLVVSGHAHGGQWRIPIILNGFYAPNQGFLPKYAGGEYVFEGMNFIVSRGLAKESTRIPRFYNRPEVVIVEVE